MSGQEAESAPVVVAEIVRSGFVEGDHRGSVVALDPDGRVTRSLGVIDKPILARSCNKPLQALGMVRLGLDLPPDLLALACASHSGETFHLEGVRRILASARLDETHLRTPADYPLDDQAREDWIRAGGGKAPICMNCSGKHAAMLATCVRNGWDLESYRAPDHPLQVALGATFAEMTGETHPQRPVDGCGAPIFATSLTGLALAFSRLVRGLDGQDVADPDAARVRDAIVAHPEMVSGTTRDELALLRALPGAIGKAGAEACYAVALPDGRAFALKIDDGSPRARPVVMAAVLAQAGLDSDAVAATGSWPLLGGGRPVGEVRATL